MSKWFDVTWNIFVETMETDFLKINSSFAVWELILHLLKLLLVANPFPGVRLPEQVKPGF